MKTLLTCVICAASLHAFAAAQEIQVLQPVLLGKEPTEVQTFDAASRGWIQAQGWHYAFMVPLKNVSETPLTVITDGLAQTSGTEPKRQVRLTVNKFTLKDGQTLVIPSRSDLRLVELRPGEAAIVKVEIKSAADLEEITVTYSPEDIYDGRFGYWTGRVSSEPLQLVK